MRDNVPLLIKHLLLTPLLQRTSKEIVSGDRRSTYTEFRDRIGRLGSALSRLGVAPGDTVAMMDWDSHRYLESYFAVPMLGAVLETVNVRLSPEQVLYCLNHAEASLLMCNVDFLPMFEELREGLTTVKKVIWIGGSGPIPDEYEEIVAGGDPEHEFLEFDEDTRATMFYTSGTTGPPKGVAFTHRQLVLHTLTALATVKLSREDVYMPMTPMFHVHAWGMPYAATVAGCKHVYPGRYRADALLRLIHQEGVTFTHCVPTLLQMLLSAPRSEDVDLRGLRMIVGGSELPRALCEAAIARGIDVFGGYGMSETCPLLALAALHPEMLGDKEREIATRMTAGQVVPLVDVRIVDSEVVVRAPWLTKGYHKNPGASEALWSGGYLHTQDIGAINADGYLQITDRIKDVIKTGGEWVSSLEVENIIGEDPAVAEVAVIGLPDAKWGERPAAVVVARAGAALEPSEIKDRVMREAERGAISKYAVPERVFFLEQLPKTSVGKLDKKRLRRLFSGDGSSPGG